jgi:hypothetical protein
MAELGLDRVLGCEQAELGTVEAGAEQLVDSLLKGIRVMEDADRLAKGRGRANFALDVVNRLLPVESSAWTRTTGATSSRQLPGLPRSEIWRNVV